MPQSTLSTLVSEGLSVGVRQAGKHPQYYLSDLVKLRILKELRWDLRIEGPASIWAINLVAAQIDDLAAGLDDRLSSWQPTLVIYGGYSTVRNSDGAVITFDDDELSKVRALAAEAGITNKIEMLIRPHFFAARHRLLQVLDEAARKSETK